MPSEHTNKMLRHNLSNICYQQHKNVDIKATTKIT